MRATFYGKKVTGILGILPQREVLFEDEIYNYSFPASQTLKLKKIMGYDKHRLVAEGTAASDLCIFGLQHIFNRGYLAPEDIDALILVTQSPDNFIPPTSNIIQGKTGLRKDIICLDINQGCAGFLVGLMQAFMLLDLHGIKKVALLNADILSKKVSSKDRNSFPLVGDAASVTIIERTEDQEKIFFNLCMDGARSNVLKIPAGGFRQPSNSETSVYNDLGDGNFRSLDNLTMDGIEIFNFVQSEVPVMIDDLMSYAEIEKENIDYFLFHQPNKFMLEKLADRLKISRTKMPANIVSNYGNSSGVTIPINIVHNLSDQIKDRKFKCCLAGFGSGLTWSSMLLTLGRFEFCEMTVSPY